MPFKELTRFKALQQTSRSAIFSKDRVHRFKLLIEWNRHGSTINFLMLNPSTADELKNDPTVERCERRARAWGYGRLIITNLYSFRATDPSVMLAAVGSDSRNAINDRHIIGAARASDLIVCGWGAHGTHLGRAESVVNTLAHYALISKLHSLKQTTGQPWHPLYLSYALVPKPLDLNLIL